MVMVSWGTFSGEPLLGAVVLVLAVVGLVIAPRLVTTETHRARVREMLTPGDWWDLVQAVTIVTTLLPFALLTRLILRLHGETLDEPLYYLDGTTVILKSESDQVKRLQMAGKLRASLAGVGVGMVVYLGENTPPSPDPATAFALVGLMVWFAIVTLGAINGRFQVVHMAEVDEVNT